MFEKVICKETGEILNVLMIHVRDKAIWIEGRNWWEDADKYEAILELQ